VTTVAVLTATGRADLTNDLNGTSTTEKSIAWGLNPSAATAAASDIALYQEAAEARVTGTSSVVTTTTASDTYQVTGTITSSSGQTIAEVGIFDSTTKPASTTWATAPSTTSGTTGTLTSGTGFASGGSAQDQDGEVMLFGTVSGTAVSVITRGSNGSTATTGANGHQITLGQVPGGSAVTGGNMLVHATFTGLALSSGDSIAFTIGTKLT
jgi:hypothetical protein